MRTLLLASYILLGGCITAPPPGAAVACPTGTSEWHAWVNSMPGPDSSPRLIVSGRATSPTGGYRYAWTEFRVAESFPVQVFVELSATPPDGAATQAVTTQDVRGEWPLSPPVGSVTITCGGTTLARIAPVETAH